MKVTGVWYFKDACTHECGSKTSSSSTYATSEHGLPSSTVHLGTVRTEVAVASEQRDEGTNLSVPVLGRLREE